jgi:hypothetical protein
MENKMTKTSLCLTVNNVKQQAKTLMNFLADNNIEISHSQVKAGQTGFLP